MSSSCEGDCWDVLPLKSAVSLGKIACHIYLLGAALDRWSVFNRRQHKFPFLVVYVVEKEEIDIVRLIHQKRDLSEPLRQESLV
jgi:hypothetical protein